MSDHSPGPWMIEPREVTALLLSKDGTHLANIFANDSDIFQPESKWANARLIAAAPEMAETITALRAEVERLKRAVKPEDAQRWIEGLGDILGELKDKQIASLQTEVERLTSLLERAVSRGCNHCMPVIGPIRKELEGE